MRTRSTIQDAWGTKEVATLYGIRGWVTWVEGSTCGLSYIPARSKRSTDQYGMYGAVDAVRRTLLI
jgi:hypothetical protein